MDKLEEHLSSLKNELVTLGSDQKALSRQVESLPGQIKEMREDVSFPICFSLLNQFVPKILPLVVLPPKSLPHFSSLSGDSRCHSYFIGRKKALRSTSIN